MIRLDEKYGILVDERNYTLIKIWVIESGKTKGNQVNTPVGYYRKLTEALEAYARKKASDAIRDADMDLKEAIEVIRESNRKVAIAIKEACPEVNVIS
jgi:hypothetical protein